MAEHVGATGITHKPGSREGLQGPPLWTRDPAGHGGSPPGVSSTPLLSLSDANCAWGAGAVPATAACSLKGPEFSCHLIMHSGHRDAFSLTKEAYLYDERALCAPARFKIESSLSALLKSKPHLFRDALEPPPASPLQLGPLLSMCSQKGHPGVGRLQTPFCHCCGPSHLANRVAQHTGGCLLKTYYVSLLRRREMEGKVPDSVERKAVRERSPSCLTP